MGLHFSVAGDDVRACSVEAARNYTVGYTWQYVLAEKERKAEAEVEADLQGKAEEATKHEQEKS